MTSHEEAIVLVYSIPPSSFSFFFPSASLSLFLLLPTAFPLWAGVSESFLEEVLDAGLTEAVGLACLGESISCSSPTPREGIQVLSKNKD